MTSPGARRRSGKALLITSVAALAIAAPALAGSVTFATFSDTSSLQLNKSAKRAPDLTIHLTEDGTFQKAGSFFTKKRFLRTNRSFESTFSFQTLSDDEAADGFTFVLRPGKARAVGLSGVGLGYAGIKNSFAVGFREYPGDSVETFKNGDVNTPLATVDPAVDLVGGIRYAWVDYDAKTHEIAVYVSDSETKPALPDLLTDRNLSRLGTTLRVGFTASTGGFDATHEIRDLYASDAAPVK